MSAVNTNPEEVRRQVAAAKSELASAAGRFAEVHQDLEGEIREVAALGSAAVPEVNFADIAAGAVPAGIPGLVRRRGCVMIRGVFSPEQAAEWNRELGRYVEDNGYLAQEKEKRGMDQYFSGLAAGQPQIFCVYWSRPQVAARQSAELAAARQWLNRLWDFGGENGAAVFNPDRECAYADRIRRRQPGDDTLGLSPHVDGGSVERWLDPGFRAVYDEALSGDWKKYDPFRAAHRPEAREIPSPAVCRMFRTYQGWTALTPQGPGDGTLRLVPVARGMAWLLLRALQDDIAADDLCGARPGRALSVTPEFHAPLLKGLVAIPKAEPGDTVWWHPDVVHAVEDKHNGRGQSNVMYIGAAPDCEKNRAFLPEQLRRFRAGRSSPDFAPEDYEVGYPDRAAEADLSPLGRRQMGIDPWN